LSQTRARIARAHAERPPQINLDWDAEEPLTRVYQGEKLPLPRSTNTPEPDYADPPEQHAHPAPAEHTNDAWYSDLHAHSAPAGARPPGAERGRARAEQALTAHVHVPVATQSQPAQILAPHAAEPPPTAATQRQRPTLAVTSTVNTVRERLGDAYAGIDRSDAALRKRVTYCSLALLVVAAVSRIVFAGATSEAGASESSQAAASSAPVLQNASVSISSDPPGARITVDGQTSNQTTPAKLTELPPGRHTISLELAGYADTHEALSLPADALVSIKLAALDEPRFAPEPAEQRNTNLSRAEQRAQARELARERRAAARAAKVLLRYRARMGLPPDPVAQELVDAYGPAASAE
jgi:hypothetical protein